IITSEKYKEAVSKKCREVENYLKEAGVSVKIDDGEEHTPGWKFNYWELRGVPLRLEVGPRDLESGQVVTIRRDNGKKQAIKDDEVVHTVKEVLENIQKNLMQRADEFLKEHTYEAEDFERLIEILEGRGGLVKINWCGLEECAEEMKNATNGGVIRGTLFGMEEKAKGSCIRCGRPASQVVYISKQY
ncbi:MAG: His/Gly/Thr/Pro-type tRNA ligase C-terminal domain-containing protein, partial [Candidatus Bathyarchaeota archaeon]